MSKHSRIPGVGKSFEAVGGTPANNPERHVYVNGNGNVDDGYSDFESRHERTTVWLESDLKRVLNNMCRRKGDKTRIVNAALRKYLSEVE